MRENIQRAFICNSGAVAQMRNIPHRVASSLCLNRERFYFYVLAPFPYEKRMNEEREENGVYSFNLSKTQIRT